MSSLVPPQNIGSSELELLCRQQVVILFALSALRSEAELYIAAQRLLVA